MKKNNNSHRRLLVLRKKHNGQRFAREIGYIYIDSGAMYRAVTLYCLDNGLFTDSGIREEELRNSLPDIRISFRLNPETQRPVTLLNGEEVEERIRTMEVSSHVSRLPPSDLFGRHW